MKKSNVNWTIKSFKKNIEKGIINFDYPIQREGGQWDNLQQSLLVHSISADYPVPAIYAISEDIEVDGKSNMIYQILDGKQRITNLVGYVNGDFSLHVDTPSVTIDGETHELAECLFEELHEDVQDQILSFNLLTYKLDEYTDEEVEDLFFRLNNGTPLSKQQKAKAKMGKEWAGKVKEMIDHDFMRNKTSFTKLQMRKADNETALMQSMMLLDENHELKSISSNDVFKYTQTFKEDEKNKMALVEKVIEAMDYLNLAYDVKESQLLKKVHFPMVIVNALYAKEKGITPAQFALWTEDFKKALKGKVSDEYIKTDYKSFGGAGSVKRYKVIGRVESMRTHMDKFFEQNANAPKKVEEPKKEDKKPEAKKTEPKAQDKKPESKKPEEKKQDFKKQDSKKPEEKKAPSNKQVKNEMDDIASEIEAVVAGNNKK